MLRYIGIICILIAFFNSWLIDMMSKGGAIGASHIQKWTQRLPKATRADMAKTVLILS